MSKHHFVAVGGTGQHVALGYADLAVLSEWFCPRQPTTFWLVDADATGSKEGRSAWEELLQQMSFLRRRTEGGAYQWPDPTLNHHKPFIDVPNKGTFGEIVDPGAGSVFFGEQQKRVPYANGYYGHAAVASTVFGEILRDLNGTVTQDGAASGVGATEERVQERRARHGDNGGRLATLLNGPSRDQGARVVVAGSAVGGTGSGCVPRLVEEISRGVGVDRKPLALLYLPWFRLDGNDDAHRRNQDMVARMSSGLLYYRDRLSEHAAAVLIGHPNIEATNRPRRWAGDTNQTVHDELALPLYGAAVAAQYFDATKPPRPALYTIASPQRRSASAAEALHLAPSVPTTPIGDPDRRAITVGRLWEQNVELLRRLLWVVAFIADQPASGVPALSKELRVHALAPARREWLPTLRAWAEAKWRAVRRLADSLPGGDAYPGGPKLPSIRAWDEGGLRNGLGLAEGLLEVRGWFAEREQPGTPEELCEALARRVGIVAEPLDGEQYASTERLVPPRVGGTGPAAAPTSAVIGTLSALDSMHAQDLIRGEEVTSYAIPNTRAREFVLSSIFRGSILKNADLATILRRSDRKDAEELLARWVGLLGGIAAGIVQVGGQVRSQRGQHALDLQEQLGIAMPESPWEEARELVWHPRNRPPVLVGYTSRHTLLVPGALDDVTWRDFSTALDPTRRDEALDTVRAWGRFLARLGKAAGSTPPWVALLDRWAAGLGHRVFGMEEHVGVRWGDGALVRVGLPRHGGRADSRWTALFEALGLRLLTKPPENDDQAKKIDAVLAGCPDFTWLGDDAGRPETRKALWTVSGVSEENRKAAAALQEQYYVSESQRAVWDVAPAGTRVEIVGNEILLGSVGYLSHYAEKRYPDVPVAEAYVDLVDLPRVAEPRVDGDKVSYVVHFRGLEQPLAHTATLEGALAVEAGCLLWPNFASEGWQQRYAWVSTLEKDVVLRLFGGDGRRVTAAVTAPITRAVAYPIGLPTLPDTGHIPAFLSLRKGATGGRAGLYLLKLPVIPRVDAARSERWGLDFGTSASVIAANRGNSLTDAVLLRPIGEQDATSKIILGSEVPLRVAKWFPSWDGKAPRAGAVGVLPSRIVFRDAATRDDRSFVARPEHYGQGWMLDHGGELESLPREGIKEEFKWGRDVSPYRTAYLSRLLEQAAAWRARAFGDASLPREVFLVLTLPMRMRGEAKAFEEDIRGVVADVKRMTGITFHPRFQWESMAGATAASARRRNRLYAALDLGGGSLDLWGSFQHGNGWAERADSLLLGGRNFMSLAGVVDSLNERFRVRDERPVWEMLGSTVEPTRVRFFELVLEVSARWIASLAREAAGNGLQPTAIEVGLLGRAWALGGLEWFSTEGVLRKLRRRVSALGVDLPLERNTEIPEDNERRKTYLASFVAHYAADAMETLSPEAVAPDRSVGNANLGPAPAPGALSPCYTGVDLVVDGATGAGMGWDRVLPLFLEQHDRLHVDTDKGFDWVTAMETRRRLNGATVEVDNELNRPDPFSLRTPEMLIRSPFHDLVERLVKP